MVWRLGGWFRRSWHGVLVSGLLAGALGATVGHAEDRPGQDPGAEVPLIRAPFTDGGGLIPLPVAIFGEDRRQPIWDLRRRDPGSLTAEDWAILQSAGRIGSIGCSSGGSNATLIRLVDGRDAVITSAHSFIDENGPRCDLTTARFLPNGSFHLGGDWTDFVLRTVETTGEVLNADNRDLLPTIMAINGGMGTEVDFLIFPLAETISTDILPDGSIRGFMRMAIDIPRNGMALLIGNNNDFFEGLTRSYEGCAYKNDIREFYHLCATTDTSSSSPLVLLVEGELLLAGMHVAAYTNYRDRVVPVPSNIAHGNIAVSMDTVRAYLDSIGVPAITAPAMSKESGEMDEIEL